MKANCLKTGRPIVVGTLTFLGLQLHLSAANASWNVATGGNWTTAANWNPAAAPGNTTSGATATGDVATFGNAAGGTVNVDAGRTVRFINIGNGAVAGAYTLTGGTLYLSSPGGTGTTAAGGFQILNTVTSSAIQTIDMPVVVAAVGGPSPTGLLISNRSSGSGLLNFTSNSTITSIASGAVNLKLEGVSTGNNTIAGVISDGSGASTLGIRKDNAGTWILTGANSYTGGTSVVGGRLFINGNQTAATGAVVAGNLATLGGNGTIGGATTMNSGSLLVVGASTSTSIGNLNFASSLNMGGTSATLEIGGASSGQFDSINVTGNLTYGGSLTINDFMGYDISGQTANYQIFGINTSQSGNFLGITVDSVALVPNTPGVWTAEDGDVNYIFDQSSGLLTVAVVPEPAAALLGSFGLLGLLRRRRM